MAKAHKTISLDSHLVDLIKIRDIEVSPIINEFLKKYLQIGEKKTSDLENLSKEIEEKEIELKALKINKSMLVKKKLEEEEKEKSAVSIEG